ncbi:MAG TPA: F0F1 ATP synthase subunit delta [Gemmatimonadaceae bacterium]|nr:F0F1 ATP synthase subunit delta [Gemmatimonadaceae bacterium]
MREPTIAKNYAEALLDLAQKDGDLAKWGRLIDQVAEAMQGDVKLFTFLQSPRIAAPEKNRILAQALEGQVPTPFLRFLQALVRNRRQMLIPQVAAEFHSLVDVVENRVHAAVTVAKATSDADQKLIADRLTKIVGKQVVPHFYVNPAIIGGLVVRVGDTVLDGSVRKRLATLKSRMLGRA